MLVRHKILLLTLLIAALLQGAAMAHGVAYGSQAHEHEGVPCALAAHSEREEAVLPPLGGPDLLLPLPGGVVLAFAGRAAIVPTFAPSPPSRAPPVSF